MKTTIRRRTMRYDTTFFVMAAYNFELHKPAGWDAFFFHDFFYLSGVFSFCKWQGHGIVLIHRYFNALVSCSIQWVCGVNQLQIPHGMCLGGRGGKGRGGGRVITVW